MSLDFEEYEPGRFSDLAPTDLGRRLWAFLSEERAFDTMADASDLGHPAVVGIENSLAETFKQEVVPDRVKQMIGHMVRQVMEYHGFVIDKQDVKVNSLLFSKATRYRRPDWTTVHVFCNAMDRDDLCFTGSRSETRMPLMGKWRYSSTFNTTLRGAIAFGIHPREVREEIAAKGYARRRRQRLLKAS